MAAGPQNPKIKVLSDTVFVRIDPLGRMAVRDELAVVFVLWGHGWKAFGTHGVDRGPEVLANRSLARVES